MASRRALVEHKGAFTFSYDGGLVSAEQWSGAIPGGSALSVAHGYNDEFLPASQTVTGGSSVSFAHDHDGLLTGAGALRITRADSAGRVSGTSVGSLTSAQSYNAWGELDSLRYDYNGSRLFSQKLTRDALGRITAVAEYAFGTSRTLGYRYDLAGRLYAVTTNGDTTAKYLYDPNGNRLSFENPQSGDTASATYDAQDRMLRYKNTAYSYSAAGELQQKVDGANTTSYAYDPLGNLNRVQFPLGDSLTYAVDGASRRVGRRGNGRWSGGWLYQNELQVVAELDSVGTVKNRYVWGAEGHVPALLIRGGSTYRLITDYLGSVRAVVNTSNGDIMQRRDYDAWGVAVKDSNAAFQFLGYAGGLTDTTTGLIRFGARDYDPATGRWTAKDPVGFIAPYNAAYTYANLDPASTADPTGLDVSLVRYAGFPGHVGVRVNDGESYGLYPKELRPDALTGTPGVIRVDRGPKLDEITFSTTALQDEIVKSMIEERKRRPGAYSILGGRVCTNFADDVMRAIGVKTPPIALDPGSYYAEVKARACKDSKRGK